MRSGRRRQGFGDDTRFPFFVSITLTKRNGLLAGGFEVTSLYPVQSVADGGGNVSAERTEDGHELTIVLDGVEFPTEAVDDWAIGLSVLPMAEVQAMSKTRSPFSPEQVFSVPVEFAAR